MALPGAVLAAAPISAQVRPGQSTSGRIGAAILIVVGVAFLAHARRCGLIVSDDGVRVRRMWSPRGALIPWFQVKRFEVRPAHQASYDTVAVVWTRGEPRWTRSLMFKRRGREAAAVVAELEASRPAATPMT